MTPADAASSRRSNFGGGSRTRAVIRTEIVIIGAGQAGLSSAYYLTRRGLENVRGYLILDNSPRAGGALQFRWPSLTMTYVHGISDLLGFHILDYIDTYHDSVHN